MTSHHASCATEKALTSLGPGSCLRGIKGNRQGCWWPIYAGSDMLEISLVCVPLYKGYFNANNQPIQLQHLPYHATRSEGKTDSNLEIL